MKYLNINIKAYYCQKRLYSVTNSKNVTPLFLKALEHGERPAIIDENGLFTYNNIFSRSFKLSKIINSKLNLQFKLPVTERSICAILPNNALYVISMLATWMSQGIFVPLSSSYPPSRLKYFIDDCNSRLVITDQENLLKFPEISNLNCERELIVLNKDDLNELTESVDQAQYNINLNKFKQLQLANKFKVIPCLIVYTSGTTSLPKGVVHSFGSIQNQMEGMIISWQWTQNDVILHSLPLHHVHGIINALMTPLYCGALCYMMPSYDSKLIWSNILSSGQNILPRPLNIFMGVPTMYAKLIEELPTYSEKNKILKNFIKETCLKKFRLFVSGSAPLPLNILSKWQDLTGHILLERYGMTEAGMILTNPLMLEKRKPGSVGMPLKHVEVRLAMRDVYRKYGYHVLCTADSKQCTVSDDIKENESLAGELHVRGPNLFSGYLNKPNETKQSFTQDGWFITGDTAAYRNNTFCILGRTSVDIIKSGGYKISALEVEHALIMHPHISEISVVGLPDLTWGQRVVAVIVLKENSTLTLKELQTWAADHLAKYQLPTSIQIVKKIEKNLMGKIDKKDLMANFK